MRDRLPGSPGKYSAVVAGEELRKMQAGKPFAMQLQLDDDPVREGTPYSKAAVLPDELAEKICPGIEDPMPKDAFIGLWEKKADGIGRKTGAAIALNDSAHTPLKGLKLFGKTTQNGIPTPESPVELESAGASGNIAVTISGNQENQILTASTPNGLPGIPVPSGGNYTDENGQQWICDEIDFARGVYVQRIYNFTLADATKFNYGTNADGVPYLDIYDGYSQTANNPTVCNGYNQIAQSTNGRHGTIKRYGPCYTVYDSRFTDKDNAIALLTEMNLLVLSVMDTEKTSYLSTEELEAYAKLHTNKPNTTVQNDAGAGMEIVYYTPATAVQMVHAPADAGKVLSIDEHGCVALTKQEDRVVEQGVFGDWTYRKWNSGVAECWLKYVDTVNIGGSVVWDKFYLSHASDISLPIQFTETPVFHVSVSGGAPVIYSGTTYVSNSATNIIQLSSYVRTEDTSKSYDITYCVHTLGKWK